MRTQKTRAASARRLSALLTALLLLLPAAALARPVGDTDDDGLVTAGDARTILRAAVGLQTLTGEARAAADTDGDGLLTAADARLALRAAVGLEAQRPIGGGDGPRTDLTDVGAAVNGIYSYEALTRDLQTLHTAMPSRFVYRSLGTTADGRGIWCARLGSGFGKRQIVIDAGIHGSEYLNPAAVMQTAAYYLRSYDAPVYGGKTVRQILADTDLYLLPMLNPDGIAISQYGLAGLQTPAVREQVYEIWRDRRADGSTRDGLPDYLRVWKANANGVDLNRNPRFDKTGLAYDTGVTAPANEEYPGNRNAPEAETAAYRALLQSLPAPAAVISVHSQGGLIYWACRQNARDAAAAKALARAVSGETGYWLDDDDSFVGATADWAMLEMGIPAVTVECGRGHNPLPAESLPGIADALRYAFLAAAALYA